MKKGITAAISRAKRTQSFVRIYRGNLDYKGGYLQGIIVASNTEYLVLHLLDSSIDLDGYGLILLRDITEVVLTHYVFPFYKKALQIKKQRPKPPFQLESRVTLSDLIIRIQASYPLISLMIERRYRDSCWIGQVTRLTSSSLLLKEIGAAATWKDETRYRFSSITYLEFGTAYEATLAAVARIKPVLPHY